MNLNMTKAGRLLMVVNFVLTAGVVVAGADFFTSENSPVDRPRVFREVRTDRGETMEGKDIFRDYSGITGAKFRTRAESGKRADRVAKPGATSALENTLRVLGTMLSNNEAFNFAVVEEVHTGKQHTVGVGDKVGSAEIVAVRADEVEVLLHGEKTVLPLDWKSRVPEKGRAAGKRKAGRSRDRGEKRFKGQAAPQSKSWKKDGAAPAKPDGGGQGGHDEIGAYLEKMSPVLGKWWKQKSPKEREQWKKWWDGRSPEERKKYEKRFLKMAKSGKNKLK
ncbi:MAG: hypothetical protein ACYS47_18340 [Planctomycetota bacterium]|jgi:hypothetical protein